MLELIMAFVGGGALAALIKGTFDVISASIQRRRAFPDTIRKMSKIYGLMDELKSTIGCDRVLICFMKNGGGIPRPGAELNVSVLFESYDSNFVSISEWWQNRRVDQQYIKTMSELEEKNVIVLHTEEMQGCLLKDTYYAQEIEASVIGKLKEAQNRYYYMSCNFKDEGKIDDSTRVHVANYIQRIKGLI